MEGTGSRITGYAIFFVYSRIMWLVFAISQITYSNKEKQKESTKRKNQNKLNKHKI